MLKGLKNKHYKVGAIKEVLPFAKGGARMIVLNKNHSDLTIDPLSMVSKAELSKTTISSSSTIRIQCAPHFVPISNVFID